MTDMLESAPRQSNPRTDKLAGRVPSSPAVLAASARPSRRALPTRVRRSRWATAAIRTAPNGSLRPVDEDRAARGVGRRRTKEMSELQRLSARDR